MKKNYVLLILVIILIYLIIDRFTVQFVWVNPNVNTKVFPYISKSIEKIDTAAEYAAATVKGCKLIYRNGYGSGFIKNNPIPNDLDYAIGVNLGTFEYNGKNSREIARLLNEKMISFQIAMYNFINDNYSKEFFTNYTVLGTLQNLYIKQNETIEDIQEGIPEIFKHKNYIKYTKKIMYDKYEKEIPMLFPFILKDNEILIEDYAPLYVYTNTIKYSKNTRTMLRELSIIIDFYADIKYGDDIVHAEIVAESFSGQRLQLSRRFFVPIVFTSSFKYLKNLNMLNDDEKYIEYRMFNFKRHLQEFSNLKELQDRPIKLYKRVLQCTDLILPVLDNKTAEEINTTINKTLNNPKIKLLNDYQTALNNLIQITSMPNMYLKAQYNNEITNHVNVMKQILIEMKPIFNEAEYKILEEFTNNLYSELKSVNSPVKLKEFHKLTLNDEVVNILNKTIVKTATDTDKILSYINVFNNILKNSGFHKFDICWLDKNLMGIVKDDFTKQISEKDLKSFAIANDLADVEYKFIDKKELSGPKVRYTVWVRYKPTLSEEIFWNDVKVKLLKDKKRFNIKFQIVNQIFF